MSRIKKIIFGDMFDNDVCTGFLIMSLDIFRIVCMAGFVLVLFKLFIIWQKLSIKVCRFSTINASTATFVLFINTLHILSLLAGYDILCHEVK